MVSQKAKEAIEKLENGRYINTREILMGGAPYTARDILIKAPLIAGLNAFYITGTGRGKTELGHDLIGYFGDASCYAIGRPDFEPSELLKQVNLSRIKDAKSDRELVELTENVRKNLYFIDELNRCPQIVQNYFFDFFDGKLVHNGKIIRLGTDNYSVGFATGNLGDGEYVGISDTDRALKDRMHIMLKLDHLDYKPIPINMLDVFKKKKSPRTDMPEKRDLEGKDIIEVHKEFLERETNPLFPFLGVYFTEGLDYLENVKSHSKMACDSRWPNLEGIRADTDENKIFPISPRGILSAIALSSALEMIAESKGKKPEPSRLFLDSLRMTVPYSGILSPVYINQEHAGDVYSAFDTLFGEGSNNREDILKKSQKIEEAASLAEAGIKENKLLKEIASREGRWAPVAAALGDYAERIAKSPTEESRKLKEAIKSMRK